MTTPSKADMPQKAREALAKKGQAMPGGRYPITNRGDLERAIQSAGRTPAAKRGAVHAYIKRRAAALGLSSMIPADW